MAARSRAFGAVDVRTAALDLVADQDLHRVIGPGACRLDLLASAVMGGINHAGARGSHSIGPADLVDQQFTEAIEIAGGQ